LIQGLVRVVMSSLWDKNVVCSIILYLVFKNV